MAEGLHNITVLGQERVKRVKEFQGQSTRPLWDYLMKGKKEKVDDFGMRIPLYLAEPGGHTLFDYSAPNFRPPIAPEDDAMRIYPSRTQIGIELNGDMLRGLKENRQNWWIKYQERVDRTVDVHKKLLSRLFHGDGTGTLAIAGNTIGGTGPATLNGVVSTGGTSGVAKTKGTAWLQKNEVYDAINPSTNAVRGTFVVTAEGRSSCAINVTAGTISTNDPICVTGGWKKAPNGIYNLANFSNRVVQGFDTTNAPSLNTPVYDAGGNAVSPAAFSYAKGLVQTRMNDEGEEKGKLCIMTPGHQKTLVNQQFQYRQLTNPKGDETVYGVASKYVDMDGDIHFVDADAADDQIRLLDSNSYGVAEDMPWGFYNDDGLTWRQKAGGGNGADVWYCNIGWQGQLYKAGVAECDAIIDDVAHSGADYITQAS